MELPATRQRVIQHTQEKWNRKIREKIQRSLEYYRAHPDQIQHRLEQLDREWDVERTLEANAGALVLGGGALGVLVNRKFFALPVVVGAFLLQHALQGWCPPLPILRRLGFRTQSEIQQERNGLEDILTRH